MTQPSKWSGCESPTPGHEVLSGVDLAIAPGQVVGLLGPNGAGKTTLLSIVAGLLRADTGRIHVNGWDVTSETLRAQRTIGFAPQSTGVYEPLTVEENLRFFGALGGVKGRALTLRVDQLTDALLLENLRSNAVPAPLGGRKAPGSYGDRPHRTTALGALGRAHGRRRHPDESSPHRLGPKTRGRGNGCPLHDPLSAGGGEPPGRCCHDRPRSCCGKRHDRPTSRRARYW